MNIEITITAGAGRGKSSVAELIRQGLKISGLNVELIDDNGYGVVEELPGVIAGRLHRSIAKIADRGTKITIRTMQSNRQSQPKPSP